MPRGVGYGKGTPKKKKKGTMKKKKKTMKKSRYGSY
tara:strand:- start:1696 stop:1803 length:108 start_codon:yes stop_codon:yes gene_type:complete